MMAIKNDVLIGFIKKNKKYSSISDDIVMQEIDDYFKRNPNNIRLLDNKRSKKYKKIIKEIRAKLHSVYGSFQLQNKNKREEYLNQLKGINDYKTHDNILSTSVSAKERIKEYPELYKKIFNITGKPKKIIDLGCGLNPVSYPYIGVYDLTYHAYDIDEKDIDFLNRYFNSIRNYSKLKAKAAVANLKNIDFIKNIPKADICFMFKFLDVIEKKGHKLSEEIIKSLNSKYLVVSFSTKTVSNKKMNHPYRGWIERMLTRINLKFERIETENEDFYIIKTGGF